MSINEDQNKLRKENVKFLKKYIDNYFENTVDYLFSKYKKLLSQNVFDENNKNDVYQYLKSEFDKLSSKTAPFTDTPLFFFSNVKIENGKFYYSKNEMMKFCSQREITDDIYPLIEKRYENGKVSSKFEYFRDSMQNTSERVFIQYFLGNLKIKKSELNDNIKYLYLFHKSGFDLFCYLDENFKSVFYPTTKYTIIYFFIKNVEYLKCSAEQYLEFVRTHCEEQLKNKNGQIKYSRLAFNDYRDEKFTKHERELLDLFKLFKTSIE